MNDPKRENCKGIFTRVKSPEIKTYDFVFRLKRKEFLKFNKKRIDALGGKFWIFKIPLWTIRILITDLDQTQHLLQTSEAIPKLNDSRLVLYWLDFFITLGKSAMPFFGEPQVVCSRWYFSVGVQAFR